MIMALFFNLFLRWNALALMAGVVWVLHFYNSRRKKLTGNTFRVFIPLTSEVLQHRKAVLKKDVFLFLYLKCWNRSKMSVDFKMRFGLENQLGSKNLFLDFYSLSSVKQILLNKQPIDTKFVHGRIYLDRSLLKVDSDNLIEMSFLSDLRLNSPDFCDDDLLVINGNCMELSSFVPIFEQEDLQMSVSLSVKSAVHKDAIFMAQGIQSRDCDDFNLWKFDQISCKYNEFFMLLSGNDLGLVKHSIRPTSLVSVEVFMSKTFSEHFMKTRDVLKFISKTIKQIQGRREFSGQKCLNKPVALCFYLVSETRQKQHFRSRLGFAVNWPELRHKTLFRLILTREISFCFYELFQDMESPKPDPVCFMSPVVALADSKIRFALDIIFESRVCEDHKVIKKYFLAEILFESFDKVQKDLRSKPLDNNFKVFEFFSFDFERRFFKLLKFEVLTTINYRRFINYSLCLSGEKTSIRVSDDHQRELHYCRDCIFNSLKNDSLPEFGEVTLYLFNQIRLQSHYEFLCLLHFLVTFLELRYNQFELFLKVIVNNLKLVEKGNRFKTIARAVRFLTERLGNKRVIEFWKANFLLSAKGANIGSVDRLEFLYSQKCAGENRREFTKEMKEFLRERYSFQKYYYFKGHML